VHAVVDASYEPIDQNCSEDQEHTFSFLSNNVNCDRPMYHHDEFKLQRYGEEEQKGSYQ
jgi:hypothetical protein